MYQIDRKDSRSAAFVQIGTSNVNSFSDTGRSANTAYIYQVRALSGSGISPNSAPHLTTTVVYSDNPLAAGVTIKANHLAELRNAVTAVRNLAISGPTNFANPGTAGTLINALDITELRNQLDPALTTLGFATPGYTDPALAGVVIKAVHFEEIRDRMQ